MIPFDTTEAMKSGVYASGTTGVGKSDILMEIADKLMKEGVIVVVFDPTQDWQNRSSIQQWQKPNLSFLPISHTSIIYDLSGMTSNRMQEMIEDFCNRIMYIKAHEKNFPKFFLIFEEAHTYFPQGCMTAKRCQNTVKMMTQGRNFGVRFACITQFASLIDKNAMRYMRQRYFGSTDEPNDVEYIKRFFPKKNQEDINVTLGTLQAGQFIYKNGNKTELVQIQPFKSETKPQEIVSSNPSPAPPSIINKPHSNGATAKAMATIIVAILWFLAIVYAISHR